MNLILKHRIGGLTIFFDLEYVVYHCLTKLLPSMIPNQVIRYKYCLDGKIQIIGLSISFIK